MESGMLPFADVMKDEVVSRFSDWHQGYRLQHSDSDEREFFKQTPPFLHNIWLSSILDPPVLHLKNMDGTDLLMTHGQFDVIGNRRGSRVGCGSGARAFEWRNCLAVVTTECPWQTHHVWRAS
jgi:hypothetical protein